MVDLPSENAEITRVLRQQLSPQAKSRLRKRDQL